MTKQAKIELFGEIVDKVHNELEGRNLEDISTANLLEMLVKCPAYLSKKCGDPEPVYSTEEMERRRIERSLMQGIPFLD